MIIKKLSGKVIANFVKNYFEDDPTVVSRSELEFWKSVDITELQYEIGTRPTNSGEQQCITSVECQGFYKGQQFTISAADDDNPIKCEPTELCDSLEWFGCFDEVWLLHEILFKNINTDTNGYRIGYWVSLEMNKLNKDFVQFATYAGVNPSSIYKLFSVKEYQAKCKKTNGEFIQRISNILNMPVENLIK